MKGEFFHRRPQGKAFRQTLKQDDKLFRYSHRYEPKQKRQSLPIFTDDIRKSQKESQIYFDQSKKSKFVKRIIDDYFADKMENNEMINFKRAIKQTVKKGKFYSPLNHYENVKNPKEIKLKNISQPISQFPDKLEVLPNTNSFISSSFLPPINESIEDNEESIQGFPQFSQLAIQVPIKQTQSDRLLSFQNEAFRVYLIYDKGQPSYRLKEYKPSGMQILRRQERSKKFGVESIWKESNQNTNIFISKLIHPLKNLVGKLSSTVDNTQIKFKVRQTNFRKYLLSNNCQQLKHLIRQICLILKKVENRVLNNKINPSNIFVLKGNKVCVGEWGYSSFRDEFDIQSSKFESRIQPILKSQKEWLVTPQYLAPQILMAVNAKTEEEEPDLWQNGLASDIWSLGITIFQLLTLIPIWMNDQCLLKTKSGKNIIRNGFLGTGDRNLQKILKKQKKFEKLAKKTLETQLQDEVCGDIKKVVGEMLQFNPQNRINVDKILQLLK